MNKNIFNVGKEDGPEISVQIGTRFLDLFSSQLYSSPQKAFEELIVNGWDAGASHIDVIIPDDLKSENAVLMVVDNGESMDKEGLNKLWNIAVSDKEHNPENKGRNVIGKFGIGKLATYTLAHEFTYVCCDKNGTIRFVTMDYKNACNPKKASEFVDQMKLNVYTITKKELFAKLMEREKGDEIIKFIEEKTHESDSEYEDEYNCTQGKFSFADEGSWTLVILSNLKEKGRSLKSWVLEKMLSSALPLGSSINIRLNSVSIKSKKGEIDPIENWEIGDKNDGIENFLEGDFGNGPGEKVKITHARDGKSIEIDGIGRVTGKFTLYEDEISSGKSAERGPSNGFQVNVLGRVVNQSDIYFKIKNLHHGTWSRFRCTVRVDGLNKFLSVHRESFLEVREVAILRELLLKIFNIVRNVYESNEKSFLSEMNDIWVNRVGFIATSPLKDFINNTTKDGNDFRKSFIQMKDENEIEGWNKKLDEDGEKIIKSIRIGKLLSDSSGEILVKYDIPSRSIVLNKDHPFIVEFAIGRNEKKILETVISAMFLSDIYSLGAGMEDVQLKEIKEYREKIMKAKAMAKRDNIGTVISLLKQSELISSDHKLFEHALSSAFRCLGFEVEHKGETGAPDGIASATVLPGLANNRDNKNYKFTYEAKTTREGAVSTKDLDLDGVRKHKKKYEANYAVIVAPNYQTQGIDNKLKHSLQETENKDVFCFTTNQIIHLLETAGEYGVIAHDKFREIFTMKMGVDEEIDAKIESIREYKKGEAEKFSMQDLLDVLQKMKDQAKDRDKLHINAITYSCPKKSGKNVTDDDVLPLIKAIEALVPQYVIVNDDMVHLNMDIATIIKETKKIISEIKDQ